MKSLALVGLALTTPRRAVTCRYLIQFRNPWGCHEWTGRFSDKNKFGEWTPAMKKACGCAPFEMQHRSRPGHI